MTLRLVPYAAASGAENMARDECLAQCTAESQRPALRFYAWTEPTLSLGYFQPHAVRSEMPAWERLPWVRRPSGGATLLHHFELTYCLTVPRGLGGRVSGRWIEWLHSVIVRTLAAFGVEAALATRNLIDTTTCLCFRKITINDVVCLGHKIVGSAQRRHRGVILQHGSILLYRSPLAPLLPGLADLTGVDVSATDLADALSGRIVSESGWSMEVADWDEAEGKVIGQILDRRYRNANWNERR